MKPISLLFQSLVAFFVSLWLIVSDYTLIKIIGFLVLFPSIFGIWHVLSRVMLGTFFMKKINKEKGVKDSKLFNNYDIKSTSKWANTLYNHFKKDNDKLEEIMTEMVKQRYKIPIPGMKHRKEKEECLLFCISTEFIHDLTDLVVWVLQIETEYYKAPYEVQRMWKKKIKEELLDFNINKEHVDASNNPVGRFPEVILNKIDKTIHMARNGRKE